jgi:uncharacterized RDD family membrane protein YckC
MDGARALAAQPFEASPPVSEPRRRQPYQPALFATHDLGRVVPIESYQAKTSERRKAGPKPDKVSRSGDPATLDSVHRQTTLFTASATARQRHAAVETVRCQNAPVAAPAHRILAAVIDSSLILVAVGVVATITYSLIGGEFLRQNPAAFFGGLAAFFGLAYKLLWAMADTDSPGLRAVQLRTFNFDGRVPQTEERVRRLAWSCLSILPAGLGLLWALVDAEKLTWHDHSSKTFLTPGADRDPRRR